MTIEQQISDLVTSNNQLTSAVENKVAEINQTLTDFDTGAKALIANISEDIRRAHVGINRAPFVSITPESADDTGALVNQAFEGGAKTVSVDWENDGLDRNWNTKVILPIGAVLVIYGPDCSVETLGGAVRADRACWANANKGGVSVHGSPMVFRNLTVSDLGYPQSAQFKVMDETSLIEQGGNNVIVFGESTYLHDEGGMLTNPRSSGLISVGGYARGLLSYVLGGSYSTSIFVSSLFVNMLGGSSDCVIRMQKGAFRKTSSDGPDLLANKGFRRLKNNGVVVPDNLLNMQPYQQPLDSSDLNDQDFPQYGRSYIHYTRGIDADSDKPRFIGRISWSFSTGVASIQSADGFGELATTGLQQIGTSTEYRAAV